MALGDGTFGGPSGQEGRAFMNGISALTKETPESSLSVAFPPREDTARNLLPVTRKWVPTRQRVCWCLDLTSSLQNCEKKIRVVWAAQAAVPCDSCPNEHARCQSRDGP